MAMTEQTDGRADRVREAMARYEGPLLRYAASLTGDLDSARDVVQDTFVRLWRADPDQFADGAAAWLFTVCRHRALDVRRKEHRMGRLDDEPAAMVSSLEPDPSALAEASAAHREVLAVLRTLPASQQEVVRLKFQAGLSYKEIAAATGHSVTNVGYLLHTALATVRERMRDDASGTPLPEGSLS
jgi:RNA polymerase sigma-70 factor (ECF subfamily)